MLVLGALLGGCITQSYQRGYLVPEGALDQIPLGASQEQVLIVLGTPSTVATISGEVFYYISQRTEQTSFLPQDDAAAIARVPGVQSVLPVKIFLSNCRASLDVIAFHGVPAKQLFDARRIELLEGDRAAFEARGDAALLGKGFAARRHLSVGDRFRFGGFEVTVAGIYASSEPIQENLIVTHLEFLQWNARVNQ